jgi:hypothetical protein
MPLENQDFKVFSGDFIEIKVPVFTPQNTIVEPDGMNAVFVVRNSNRKELILLKTQINPEQISIVKNDTMEIIVKIRPSNTPKESVGVNLYEVKIIDTHGNPSTVAKGRMHIVDTLYRFGEGE